MLRPRFIGLILFLAMACTAADAPAATIPPKYNVTELLALPGATGISVNGLNDANQAIGSSLYPTTSIATLWNNGMPVSISPEANQSSSGGAIANNGDFIGYSNELFEFHNGIYRAFALPSDGYGQLDSSSPVFINSLGEVAGIYDSYDPAYSQSAILWKPGGLTFRLTNLPQGGSLGGFNDSEQFVINTASYDTTTGQPETLLTRYNSDGTFNQLAVDASPYGAYSAAFAISNRGQVVGNFGSHAMVWTGSDVVLLLSPVGAGGTSYSAAYAINDSGSIVGTSGNSAVLWNPDGTGYDLNSLLTSALPVPLTDATAINASGAILAYGYSSSTNSVRQFLLTPIPEPTPISIAILAILLGINRTSRRRSFVRTL